MPRKTTLSQAYAGMSAGFEEMKERIRTLELQEKRLLFVLKHGITVGQLHVDGKYMAQTREQQLSGWHENAINAIDEAMENLK
jgi:hypothetical protein